MKLFAITALLGLAASAYAGVSVSQPSDGATVPLSMHVVASASPSSGHSISAMMIYVNSSKAYSTSNSSLDTYVPVKSGSNKVQVKAWDGGGAYWEKTLYVTGSSTTSSTNTSSGSGPGVYVSSPSSSSASSPVHFVISATPASGHSISYIAIYSNGSKVYSKSSSSTVDTYVSLASGTDDVQVKAWDGGGNEYKKEFTLSVGGTTTTSSSSTSSSTTTISSSATNLSNIDQRSSGWFSCDSCAGSGANSGNSTYWMKTGVSSPSKDGKAAEFFLGGTQAYSNALWSQKLVGSSSTISGMHHFVNDLYWYYTNAHAAQGFEFNISEYIGGKGYVYGIQCNLRSGAGPHWDISVPEDYSKPLTLTNMKWQNTGISCNPKTYTWNHVTLEFARTSTDKVQFVALTLNGTKHYINVTVPHRIAPSDWLGLNTHFQMNGNYQQEDYKAWVDKWTVTYW